MRKFMQFVLLSACIGCCSCVPKEVQTVMANLGLPVVPSATSSYENLPPDPIYVTAEGYGATKIEALNNAWMESVRTATGMYLTSKTIVRNDDLFEEIATLSEGRVRNYKELYIKQEKDGTWNVSIEAQVDRNIIRQASRTAKKYETEEINSLTANLASLEDYMSNLDKAGSILVSQYRKLDRFFDHSFKIELDRYTGDLTAYHFITLNLDEYVIFADKFDKIVSAGANEKDYQVTRCKLSEYKKEILDIEKSAQEEFRGFDKRRDGLWRGDAHSDRLGYYPDFKIAKDPERVSIYNTNDKAKDELEKILINIFTNRGIDVSCVLHFYNEKNKLAKSLKSSKYWITPIYYSTVNRTKMVSPAINVPSDTVIFIRQVLPIKSEELHSYKNIIGKVVVTKHN